MQKFIRSYNRLYNIDSCDISLEPTEEGLSILVYYDSEEFTRFYNDDPNINADDEVDLMQAIFEELVDWLEDNKLAVFDFESQLEIAKAILFEAKKAEPILERYGVFPSAVWKWTNC